MKFRIRYKSTTKLLTLQDGVDYTLGQIKTAIQQNLLSELLIPSAAAFDISLNGTSSLGPDSVLLSTVGVVSGDLVKIIIVDTEAQSATSIEESSSSVAASNRMEESNEVMDTREPSASSTQSFHVVNQPVGEMSSGILLLEDYENGQPLPPLLQSLFQLTAVKNKFHAMCILLHNLMLESGFVVQSSDISTALSSVMVSVDYTHPATAELLFTLSCNTLGQFIVVNGLVHSVEEEIFTLQLKTSDFIGDFNPTTKSSVEKKVYKNLGKVSKIFKKEISHKALDAMRDELKLPPLHGILSLFPELHLRIMSYLDAASLCTVAQTCRALNEVSCDDILWRALYMKRFPRQPRVINASWKELYKRENQQKLREERERLEREREIMFPPPVNPFPDMPGGVPLPDQPLGMLGGDYDLDPSFPYGPFGGRGNRRPSPFAPPTRPRFPGSGNPLPGSRYDPMNPFGGFRPGRGGGMMDDDPNLGLPRLPRRRQGFGNGGFGGFM